ncbi:DUF6297 family protein [Jidongwangia harbinensis]|uniref:DUF6297 family protein n=1 Tax=Jidongwangia harbinensis TaxID=2878561 RepID=UPI001CD973D6|nr:DUF6297 family protein [Jidongwangia harbinensis]MCA2217324.1 DUF6297 family protein [Jidongwangia harbinensis]
MTAGSSAPPVVRAGPVRRWIRRTRSAHRDRGESAGTAYLLVFLAVVVGGLVHRYLRAVFWPVAPNASALAGVALFLVVLGTLHPALRRLGPVALSRPATSWLLTAPLSRRVLLLPALWLAAVSAGGAAGLATLAIVGHVAPRPVPGQAEVILPAIGALAGVGVLLVAMAAQAGRRRAAWLDGAASLVLAAGLAGLVVDSAVDLPPAAGAWPDDTGLLAVAGALALAVTTGLVAAVRGLAGTPNDRILEAAATAGTLLDSAHGVEPSFVTDLVQRRYWARRRLRSARLRRRVPVLIAQDLLLVRRRPGRLVALAGAVALPALLASAPPWLLAVAVLAGGTVAAGTSTATVRTDAGNPVLLRLLGLGSRAAIAQRLCVPGVLAALWCTAALTVLRLLDVLPAGPWWALGLVLGPVGAVIAVRRARAGFVDNGLLPIDTPMGTLATGPLIGVVVGIDMLVLGLPTVLLIAVGGPLTWAGVTGQAVAAALGVWAYLRLTTSPRRVDL